MGIHWYRSRHKRMWRIDEYLEQPTGPKLRFRQRDIPTKEQAELLLAQKKVESFEGRFFDRRNLDSVTVQQVWERYRSAHQDSETVFLPTIADARFICFGIWAAGSFQR